MTEPPGRRSGGSVVPGNDQRCRRVSQDSCLGRASGVTDWRPAGDHVAVPVGRLRMVKVLLTVAAAYLAAIGAALLLVPAQFGVDAVPDDPSSELIALLRLLGGPFLGIAVLNWLWRA